MLIFTKIITVSYFLTGARIMRMPQGVGTYKALADKPDVTIIGETFDVYYGNYYLGI